MQDEKIIGRRDGPVGHVVFNNPTKLNAVSLDMWERVHALLTEYADHELSITTWEKTTG